MLFLHQGIGPSMAVVIVPHWAHRWVANNFVSCVEPFSIPLMTKGIKEI